MATNPFFDNIRQNSEVSTCASWIDRSSCFSRLTMMFLIAGFITFALSGEFIPDFSSASSSRLPTEAHRPHPPVLVGSHRFTSNSPGRTSCATVLRTGSSGTREIGGNSQLACDRAGQGERGGRSRRVSEVWHQCRCRIGRIESVQKYFSGEFICGL